jgi:D-serine deaminase-like pyridoxal phosphate-dependent protein
MIKRTIKLFNSNFFQKELGSNYYEKLKNINSGFESIDDLETPSILIDKKILINNIEKMQNKANKFEVNLRPHVKTHKSSEIAKIQLEKGAIGITTSKMEEELIFLEKGFNNILLAYPVNLIKNNNIYKNNNIIKIIILKKKIKI